MRRTVERELKLTPTDGFRLADLEGVQLPSRDFVSTYFDTPELSLARAGITLRHRGEGGSRLWQLKVPHGAARIELEVAGPPARPPEELLALLVVHLRGARPDRVARLRTRRKTVRVDGAEVVDDSVSVLDGQRVKMRFRELEVELTGDGDERTLRRLEKKLVGIGAEPADFRTKLARALDLAGPEMATPVSSEDIGAGAGRGRRPEGAARAAPGSRSGYPAGQGPRGSPPDASRDAQGASVSPGGETGTRPGLVGRAACRARLARLGARAGA